MHESEPALAHGILSEEEFLALPETMQRIELVDGEVVVGPSPSFWHQGAVGDIYVALDSWARAHTPAVVGLAPLDVRLARGRIVQPDVAVWLGGLASTATPLRQIPDLVVEVLSSDRIHDRVTKRFLYAEAGVLEYWIVDPSRRVERLQGAGLVDVEVAAGQLASPLLPGFVLDVARLFARS